MGSWHTGTVRAADVFAPLIMNQRKCRSCSFWWRNWSETYITTLNLPISVSFQAISGCGDLQYSGRPRKTADHSRSSQINNESPESFIFRAQNAYTSLKGDASYCKRVSWMSDKPAVAVYEYQGQLPVVKQPHGSARCTESEFVRSKPQVLAAVRTGKACQAQRRVWGLGDCEWLTTGHETTSKCAIRHRQFQLVVVGFECCCWYFECSRFSAEQFVCEARCFAHGNQPVIVKKPIISPSWTDANSIISPGLIIYFVSVREKACYHGYSSVLNNL